MPGLMTALLNSNWICWVMRISFSVTTMSAFFFGQPGLSPPRHARRVRAEVVEVGDAVAVVVRVGAAVVVLEAVEVLGLVRALVLGVGDAVGVVVGVGAAVVVEVAVLVLGLEDALVAASRGCRRRRCPCRPGLRSRRTSTNSRAVQRSARAHAAKAACAFGSAFARCACGVRELRPDRARSSANSSCALARPRARAARTSSRRSSRRRRRVVVRPVDLAAQRGPLGAARSRSTRRPASERGRALRVRALHRRASARLLRELDRLVGVLLGLSARFAASE